MIFRNLFVLALKHGPSAIVGLGLFILMVYGLATFAAWADAYLGVNRETGHDDNVI
jgi:hypothetical protein